MTLYPKLITDALATVMYAGTKKNIIESGMLADDVRIDGMKVTITLLFPKETDPFLKSTLKAAESAIHYHVSKDVEVEIKTEFASKPRPEVGKLLPQVKNIVAVSSAKALFRQTLLLHLPDWAIRWAFWMPTSSVRLCLRCSMWRTRDPMPQR